MAFVDTHAHLDGPAFSEDLDEVLARAQDVGLTHIICIGNIDSHTYWNFAALDRAQ